MNKKILVVGILPLLVATGTQAVDKGTVSFNGKLMGGTCDVTVDGQGPDGTVTLPTLTADEANTSARTGTTPFTINMTGCTGNYSQTRVFFESGSGVDASTNYIKNTGDAQNVDLVLTSDAAASVIVKPGDDASQQYATISAGAASQKFYVSYVSDDGTATSGTVTGSVTYHLDYK